MTTGSRRCLESQAAEPRPGQLERSGRIISFRASKKPVHAFLAVDVAGEAEMYVAGAADKVTINPGAALLLNGLLAEVSFYKGTLEKLHIVRVYRIQSTRTQEPILGDG
jgi:protease-4